MEQISKTWVAGEILASADLNNIVKGKINELVTDSNNVNELIETTQEVSATSISNAAERCELIYAELKNITNDLQEAIDNKTEIKILDTSKGQSEANATDANTIYFVV